METGAQARPPKVPRRIDRHPLIITPTVSPSGIERLSGNFIGSECASSLEALVLQETKTLFRQSSTPAEFIAAQGSQQSAFQKNPRRCSSPPSRQGEYSREISSDQLLHDNSFIFVLSSCACGGDNGLSNACGGWSSFDTARKRPKDSDLGHTIGADADQIIEDLPQLRLTRRACPPAISPS